MGLSIIPQVLNFPSSQLASSSVKSPEVRLLVFKIGGTLTFWGFAGQYGCSAYQHSVKAVHGTVIC